MSVCTNIACLLGGALELLEHAESTLGVRAGGTTADGVFTLDEAECLADCDRTPACRSTTATSARRRPRASTRCVEDLRGGRLSDTVPPHGTLVRVRRSVGPPGRPRRHRSPSGPPMAEAQAARAAAAGDSAGAKA